VKQSSLGKFSAAVLRNFVFTPWIYREHPAYLGFKAELDRTQFLPADKLRELQLERLQRLMEHAWEQCPFYRERLQAARLDGGKINDLDRLRSLPPTTKRDLQDQGARMCAADREQYAPVRNQTGGSTGSPVQFYVDSRRFGTRLASAYRTDEWAGLRPGDWHAYLWGASMDLTGEAGLWPTVRNHLLRRRIELNTSSVSEEDWRVFLRKIRKLKPEVFVAYSQAAVLFARYVRDQGLNDIQFKSVIATAEVLSDSDRFLIEEAFRAKVFNRYGCREVSTIAAECEFHNGMHISAESLLVEILPDESAPPGMGKILVTDLLNRSMPLIRYEIGDVGAWAEDQKCPCGRGLALLGRLEGRITDFLTLRDQRKLSGVALLTWVFASMDEVRQVQFVQHQIGDVTLKYVPGPKYNPETENHLRKRLEAYFKGQADLALEQVQQIPKEASGKYRFIVHSPRLQEMQEGGRR
jgi:phenylacetate-CoA ligase